MRGRDGYEFDNERLRVEFMRGNGGDRGRDRGERRERTRGGQTKPTDELTRGTGYGSNRVIVTGLPPSASWQDLKDHFKPTCSVTRSDVDGQGLGLIELKSAQDLDEALKLDGSEFKNPNSGEGIITVQRGDDYKGSSASSASDGGARDGGGGGGDDDDEGEGRRGRDRSRDRSRDRYDDDEKDADATQGSSSGSKDAANGDAVAESFPNNTNEAPATEAAAPAED